MSAEEDADGFLWFGRVDGLYRFDGNTFTVFLPNPADSTAVTHGRPQHLTAGRHRDLWIGTIGGGLSRYDLETNKFESFHSSILDSFSLAGNIIGGIYPENDSIVWVGSNHYCLNRLNRNSRHVERYYTTVNDSSLRNKDDHLGKIVADQNHDSILWVAAPFGLLKFNKIQGKFTDRFYFDAYWSVFKRHFTALYSDKDGYIWAGGISKLVRIDPTTREVRYFNLRIRKNYNKYDAHFIPVISQYSDSTLLVQTYSNGTILFNRYTQHVERINSDIEVGKGSLICLLDKSGNIWLKDKGALITGRQRPSVVKHIKFSNKEGRNWSRDFLTIPGKNHLYIGTMHGAGLLLVDFESKSYQPYSHHNQKEGNGYVLMNSLAWSYDSTIYIGSDQGLLRFSPKTEAFVEVFSDSSLFANKYISAICVSDSTVWFAIPEDGLYSFHISEGNTSTRRRIHIPHVINKMVCQGSSIWLATERGLAIYNLETLELQWAVPDMHITDLYISLDTIWASTYGEGLLEYHASSEQSILHNMDVGGGTNLIFHFTRDKQNIFWLNTDGGRVKFNYKTNKKVNYRASGLGKRSPIVQLPDGKIITGGNTTVGYFMAEDMNEQGVPPKVYIKSINIANRADPNINPNGIKKITLLPNEKELVFEFGALNFNPISWNNFQYRLLGLDSSWIDIKRHQFIVFNNLPTGEYVFELRATNAYGAISTSTKKIELSVRPSIYQIWYVQLTIALLIALLLYLIYRRRLKIKENKWNETTVEYFVNSKYAESSADEILWDLARNVISRLQFEDCVVYLFDKDKGVLQQKAAYGIKNPRGREILNPMQIQLGQGIVGSAAQQKETIIVDDISKDKRYIQDVDMNGSEISVPIIHQGEIIGVIDSEHSKKHFFTNSHATVLTRIARECAHKIAAAQTAEKIAQKEVDLLEMQKEIAELKLTALQAQMNPHFIFNSLNSINWYILKNKTAEASMYLTKFSKLVRLILDNSYNLSIALDEELKVLKLYLDLEAMRFDHKFDYEIQTDDALDLEEVFVPPLILQPFVENAIWHGLIPKKEKGKLLIQVFLENNVIKCIVQDDGIGRHAARGTTSKQAKAHQSKGLKLTTDRINLLHKDYLQSEMVKIIDLVNDCGLATGTRVEVILPYHDD